MARDTLQISAAGTIIERIFSFARQVCSSNRSNLSPEMIKCEMMVFCDQRAKHRTVEEDLQEYRLHEGLYGLNQEDLAIEMKRQEEELIDKLSFRFIPDSASTHVLSSTKTPRNEERSRILCRRIQQRQITQTLERDPSDIAKRRAMFQDADRRLQETPGIFDFHEDESESDNSDQNRQNARKRRLSSFDSNHGFERDNVQGWNVNLDRAEVALLQQKQSALSQHTDFGSRYSSLKRVKRLPARYIE